MAGDRTGREQRDGEGRGEQRGRKRRGPRRASSRSPASARTRPLGWRFSLRGIPKGLSKSHKWEMSIGGELLKLGGVRVRVESRMPTDRGRITRFSRKSRQRLLRKARTIDQGLADLPATVDLTYPGERELVPTDGRVVQHHLKAFWDRLQYRFPGVSALWVEEFQKRGAPHLHLMVYGLPRRLAYALRLWVSRVWWEVVGSGDADHRKSGTRVAPVESWKKAVGYLAAYAGKAEQKTIPVGFENMGRFWGVKGRKNWCITRATGSIPARAFYPLKRVVRGWLERKTGRRDCFDAWWKGYTVYLTSRVGFRLLAWAGAFS